MTLHITCAFEIIISPSKKVIALFHHFSFAISTYLKGLSNKEDEKKTRKNALTDKKMSGRERGGEECPRVLRQIFVLVRPISVVLTYMNPTLIGGFRCDMF